MKKIILILFLIPMAYLLSDISEEAKKQNLKKQKELKQLAPAGFFDNRKSNVSNLEFFASNYGILGYDIQNRVGGGYWPRNSRNQYIFGGGAWFASQRDVYFERDTIIDGVPTIAIDTIRRKYVEKTYSPNTARSWFVPGRVLDKNLAPTYESDPNDIYKYRTYFATDFNRQTGQAIDPAEQSWPAWPYWDIIPEDTVKVNRYFGLYVEDEDLRTSDVYPDGPAFISEEDIFSTYKDTDLNYYDGGVAANRDYGYPLYVQIEQMIYSWGFGQYKDFIFVKWDFLNFSGDTLWDCWHAPIMDVDIARNPLQAIGARNDRVQWYPCDDTLNMAVQWTDTQNGEAGFGFGYLGFDYLESPSVQRYFVVEETGNKLDTIFYDPDIWKDPEFLTDPNKFPKFLLNRDGDTIYANPDIFDNTGFLRKTKRVFDENEQLGLVTFENWSIESDVIGNEPSYEFMSSRIRQGDTGPGDKRFMMATGPYNMAPFDTARVVVGIILAKAASGGEATGTCEDMQALDKIDRFAQQVYDDNFKSPLPPERPVIKEWVGLNNAIEIQWDNTAELSIDPEADGLDFLGYKIYRSRRPELDTFSLTPVNPTDARPGGVGPLGWRQVAQYQMPTPFQKSNKRAGGEIAANYPRIDSLKIIGPILNQGLDEPDEEYDQMSIAVMRIPRGAIMYTDRDVRLLTSTSAVPISVRGKVVPIIRDIDSSLQTGEIWGNFFHTYMGGTSALNSANPFNSPALYYDNDPSKTNNKIFDSILVGKAEFNRALVPYNPLLFKNTTITINNAYRLYLQDLFDNGKAINDVIVIRREKEVRDTLRDSLGNIVNILIENIETTSVDSAFYWNSLRSLNGEYIIDVATKRTPQEILNSIEHANETLESLYEYIQNGLVTIEWPTITEYENVTRGDGTDTTIVISRPFEETSLVRKTIISPYMDFITNGRKFRDFGDNNGNNIIEYSSDPLITEKLINNVPYYYKLVPFDEGDFTKVFPQQENNPAFSANYKVIPSLAETFPEAPPTGKKSKIEIIEMDSTLMGGIYNLNFFAMDEDRLQQYYAGDTLELTFTPGFVSDDWIEQGQTNLDKTVYYSLYNRFITLRNLSNSDNFVSPGITIERPLYQGITQFEPVACDAQLARSLTENAASYILTSAQDDPKYDTLGYSNGVAIIDTNDMNKMFSKYTESRIGNFSTGRGNIENYCYSFGFPDLAYGVLGFEYDFAVKQFGGVFRPDTVIKLDNAISRNTNATKLDLIASDLANANAPSEVVYTTMPVQGRDFGIFGQRNPLAATNELETVVTPARSTEFASFNNGPGEYILEFSEGGEELVSFNWGGNTPPRANTKEFRVKYLNVKVTNITDYKRFDPITGDSIPIKFPSEVPYMELPAQPVPTTFQQNETYRFYPHPVNLSYVNVDPKEFIGKFNIYNAAWIDVRNFNQISGYRARYAYPNNSDYGTKDLNGFQTYSGLQGKYYLNGDATDGSGTTVHFSHIVNIAGCNFVLDFPNIGSAENVPGENAQRGWQKDPNYPGIENAVDFQVGDRVEMITRGGAQGLPWPGFTVKAVVTEGSLTQTSFEESDLNEITIVPNPYYITHENTKSPYASELYFQRLPRKCTIEIYTQAGDLVKKIDHEGTNENGRIAVDIWDLSTESGFRIQSQTLIAVIKTPDGAEKSFPFSIVVGSYRIVTE